jgi:hypothetical protein
LFPSRISMRFACSVKRTTIMLPEDLDARLRHEARRRGSSVADVTRDALLSFLPEAPKEGRLSFFAIGEGSPSDASERVDELVGKAVVPRRGSRPTA